MNSEVNNVYSNTRYNSFNYKAFNNNPSTLEKVQKQYWFTKSAIIRKLGKKEDEHVIASDAELDAKIDLYNVIDATTKELKKLTADYQTKICALSQEEISLGRLLKEFSKQDVTKAGKIMMALGKNLNSIAQSRICMRDPLVRLYQEVDTFHLRAVEDTRHTVEEMEKARTEYRGALMWMKNISQDFNPEHHQQLEKFREVQMIVKRKKQVFDQLKLKCLQKIDLMATSRCNMFSHALICYQNNLISFSEKTAKTLQTIVSKYIYYEPYKFEVIKELADPFDKDYKNEVKSKKNTTCLEASEDTIEKAENETLINFVDNIFLESQVNNSLANDIDSKLSEDIMEDIFPNKNFSPSKTSSFEIFGCDSSIVSSDIEIENINSVQKDNDKFFLPSQLLNEKGLKSMSDEASSLLIPRTYTSETHSNMSQSHSKPYEAKKKAKVDWYDIFKSIDPLTDPGHKLLCKDIDTNPC